MNKFRLIGGTILIILSLILLSLSIAGLTLTTERVLTVQLFFSLIFSILAIIYSIILIVKGVKGIRTKKRNKNIHY